MIRPTYTYRLTRPSPHRWRFLGMTATGQRIVREDTDRLLALVAGLERMGMTTPHTRTGQERTRWRTNG